MKVKETKEIILEPEERLTIFYVSKEKKTYRVFELGCSEVQMKITIIATWESKNSREKEGK